MRSVFGFLAAAALLLTSAEGIQYNVTVGKGGLLMTPNTTFAAVGDTVEFFFYNGFHDVVQGSFSTPCHVGNVVNGFSSAFMRVTQVEGTTAFRITVANTDPMWFYCSQGNATTSHCHAGMVGVINPPASPNVTLAMYAAAAKLLTTPNDTPGPNGGVNVTIDGINSTVTATAVTSAASATSLVASSTGSSASAAASSTAKAAAAAVTLTWEVLAAAGAVVGGAMAYMN